MEKPKLDYAFLADYAKVENDKLTAVGASYTYVLTQTLPATHLLSVAGRIRATEEAKAVPLAISVSFGDQFNINLETELSPANIRPYRGFVGVLFAVTLQIPLLAEGLVEVNISVAGEHARRLAFEVALAESL